MGGTTAGVAALARDLSRHGTATALIREGRRISYSELAGLVAEAQRRLGSHRRLVAIEMHAALDPVVAYLACLAGGHVALLLPAGPDDPRCRDIVAAYRPDAVVAAGIDGWGLDLCGTPAGVALHPDLALLLSTSGSTGSPKTVRLSHDNLQSNAEAIAEYLSLLPGDVVPTTLPLSYCYGLSLLNSHLSAGAAVALTGLSVVDECFWNLMTATGATTLAGVPYTFDLLAAAGFADRDLPTLRRVLQAGGAMDRARVRELAGLGSRRGFELFVMYGQTEATARMAYLPPWLAATRPDCIGVAIPGGELRLDPLPGAARGVGELVYRGRNVMLGYAEGAEDLARGAELAELRTGDLAEQDADGLFRIVGRRSRIAKPFGLRIDLNRMERELSSSEGAVLCVEVPGGIGMLLAGPVWHETPGAVAEMRDRAVRFTGLPVGAVRVVVEPDLPRLGNGKPDYAGAARRCQEQPDRCGVCREGACPVSAATSHEAAVTADARSADHVPGTARTASADDARSAAAAVAEVFARLLGVPRVRADDTFVGLGGDSLSYVAVSAALSQRLGALPGDWPRRTVAELARGATPDSHVAGRGWRSVEVPVLVRSSALVLVVGSHIGTFDVRGGAHLLLGVAGYSFARFHLGTAGRIDRVRAMLAAAGRLALLCLMWLVPLVLLSDEYGSSVLLVNNLLGPDTDSPEWRYWFVEALLYVSVGAAAVLAVPAVDRWQRRFPFGLPAGFMGAGALAAVLTTADSGPASMYTPVAVAWLFCAGWALAAATRTHQQVVVIAAVAATAMLFFNRPDRTAVVVAGLALVAFVAHVRLPRRLAGPVNALAAASLAVYLSHYQVYPLLPAAPWAGLALSLVVGVMLWTLIQRLTPRLRAVRRVSPQVGVGRAPTPRVRLFPGLPKRSKELGRVPAGLQVARRSGRRPLRTTPGRDHPSVQSVGAR